jgi:hypothetical protein
MRWLRHLGARRSQLTADATAEVNQVRDLLECAWPAVLSASGSPFRSASWRAAVAVMLDRCAGDLGRVRRLGEARFTAAVRRELPRWGATRPCLRIVRAVFEALAGSAGVTAHRPGALERAHLAMGGWQATRTRLTDAEARMVAVLDDLCPRDNACGGYQGKTPVSGRGRPALRLAAWRAVRAALPSNPVMAARFIHLTTRGDNRLARQQARTACAAALLRWIHVVITRQVAWDPAIAAGSTPAQQAAGTRSPCADHRSRQLRPRRAQDPGGASPNVPRGTTSRKSMGSPARLLTELDSRCREQPA